MALPHSSHGVHIVNIELGNSGVQSMMRSKNDNEFVDLEINLRGSDGQIATASENEKKIKIFSPNKPEGNYSLDMEVV